MAFQGHHRIGTAVHLCYVFLFVINSHHMPNWHCFPANGCWKSRDLEMTFQGHNRLYLLAPLYSSCMVSYMSLVGTICLTGTVSLQKAVGSLMTLKWSFKVTKAHMCGPIVYLGYVFLSVANGHHVSNRHRFPIKGCWSHMTLKWPFKVIIGHICWHHCIPWVWVSICH